MRKCVYPVMLILAGIAISPVLAIPSFRGYTGLMIIPTADALGLGQWNAGVFLEDVSEGTINDFIANYGIAPNLEVGFNRFRLTEDDDASTLINAKWGFLRETTGRPGVAAGIIDVTNDVDTTVYVVASKSFANAIGTYEGDIITPRVHVGFGAGGFDGLFAGLSTYLGNRLQIMAEWDSNNVQVGARFRATPGFTIHAGGFNVGDRSNPGSELVSDSASFGVGVSYQQNY
jgi:hypothetical protein